MLIGKALYSMMESFGEPLWTLQRPVIFEVVSWKGQKS